MNEKFEDAVLQLMNKGYGVVDNWLPVDKIEALSSSLLNRYESSVFITAGIGNNSNLQINSKIRSDEIFWLDKSNSGISEYSFLDHVEKFIDYLNQTCYAGIHSYEFHYAVYEPGSSYARHCDQFRANDQRKYSMVFYLNKNWEKSDGGQLVIYNPEPIHIAPLFGRFVFFRSDIEHEVLKSNFQRKSITGWLRN